MFYEALRPFQAEEPVQPGAILDARDWPHGRAEKLVDQRYIRPVTVDPEALDNAVRRAESAEARIAELEDALTRLKSKLAKPRRRKQHG